MSVLKKRQMETYAQKQVSLSLMTEAQSRSSHSNKKQTHWLKQFFVGLYRVFFQFHLVRSNGANQSSQERQEWSGEKIYYSQHRQ